MATGIIYKATCFKTGRSYIGQTTMPLERRIIAHKSQANSGADFVFYRALRKYPDNNDWEWLELETCDESDLDDREVYYIDLFNTYHNGYNSTLGGGAPMRGKKHSQETLLHFSESRRGENNSMHGVERTSEWRKNHSAFMKGRTPWNKGKKIRSQTPQEKLIKSISGKVYHYCKKHNITDENFKGTLKEMLYFKHDIPLSECP